MRTILPAGSLLRDRYVLDSVCGRGGFGVTYKAWDPILDCTVAIKEYTGPALRSELSDTKQQRNYEADLERFLEEARCMAKLRDLSGAVYVYDFFRENGTAYIVMEYLEGETLRQRLKREGCLDVSEAVAVTDDLLQILSGLHKRGMLHRDIAPDNVYLMKDGSIRLLDFGCAVEKHALMQKNGEKTVCVKPGYSAPEQYDAKMQQGPWTDVYSVGAVLYNMLTGMVPPDVPVRVSGKAQISFGDGREKELKGLAHAVRKALDLTAGQRFQSTEEFRAALNPGKKRKGRDSTKRGTIKDADGNKGRVKPAGIRTGVMISCTGMALLMSVIFSFRGRLFSDSQAAESMADHYVVETVRAETGQRKESRNAEEIAVKESREESTEESTEESREDSREESTVGHKEEEIEESDKISAEDKAEGDVAETTAEAAAETIAETTAETTIAETAASSVTEATEDHTEEIGKQPFVIPDFGTQAADSGISWGFNGSDWLCTAKDGSVLTGWQASAGGRWYYLNQTTGQRRGAMEKGFLFDPADGNYYYLDPASGAMATGWTHIDGYDYFFATGSEGSGRVWSAAAGCYVLTGDLALPEGAMVRNTVTEDGYILDNEGVCSGKISVD